MVDTVVGEVDGWRSGVVGGDGISTEWGRCVHTYAVCCVVTRLVRVVSDTMLVFVMCLS